jgi:spore maturation protein CgeB
MKFLRVAGVHYSFAKHLPYHQNSALSSQPYRDQLRTIFSYFFNYGDSLTDSLRSQGYEAEEVLYDVEPLQKKWAQENGFLYSENSWEIEILIRQIRSFKPEVLYLHNAYSQPLFHMIQQRKELFPFLQTLILFRGYPEIDRPLAEFLSCADILLVGSPILERICKKHGLKPHRFSHYFDPRVLSNLTQNQTTYPVTFLGTSGFGYGWNHQPRYRYLLELLKTTQIECWLEEKQNNVSSWKEKVKCAGEILFRYAPETQLQRLAENCSVPSMIRKMAFNSLARKIEGSSCPKQPLRTLFPQQCHGPLFGLSMYETLASSSLTFNKHTFAARGTVDNIRLFEATGVGTCLFTDTGSNLSELFEPDREVVTYSSVDECRERMHYLLRNKAAREQIAAQGQKRTLREHTATCRALQMHELIQKRISWD